MSKLQSVDMLLTRARKAAKDAEWAVAHECYQNVLERFPGNKRAKQGIDAIRPLAFPELLKMAQDANSERRWADAEQLLTLALALAPEMIKIGLALAECQMELRRAPAALKTATEILKLAPNNPQALNFKGRALSWMGRGRAAHECFQLALGHQATDAQSLNNLGIVARAQGDQAAATDYYRRAIAVEPKNPVLHKNLAEGTTYSKDDPHLEEMLALLTSKDQNDPDNAPLYFAVFKALDELDERAEAFAKLEKGNRLIKAALRYDFQKDAIPSVLGKTLLKAPVGRPEETDGLRPIFVTGLPRSGTTLLERILAQDEGAQPCGELTVVQLSVIQLMRNVMDRSNKVLTKEDIGGLGREIRAGLAEYSDGRPYLIDKMPLNFRWIGYICDALPEAQIVHISRDPMAVAWSLYQQSFDGVGNGFAYDPEDIARFMVLHRDLIAHWHKCFPGRITEVAYEELVSDPTTVTQALAAATGLEWSPDWLAPERATNQVLTASADQVRRPIYGNSNNQWKRYESQLAPMVNALSRVGLLLR